MLRSVFSRLFSFFPSGTPFRLKMGMLQRSLCWTIDGVASKYIQGGGGATHHNLPQTICFHCRKEKYRTWNFSGTRVFVTKLGLALLTPRQYVVSSRTFAGRTRWREVTMTSVRPAATRTGPCTRARARCRSSVTASRGSRGRRTELTPRSIAANTTAP